MDPGRDWQVEHVARQQSANGIPVLDVASDLDDFFEAQFRDKGLEFPSQIEAVQPHEQIPTGARM